MYKFSFVQSVSGKATVVTREMFHDIVRREKIGSVCRQIAEQVVRMEGAASDEERKAAQDAISKLKRSLPAFCWHAWFDEGKRKNYAAHPGGLVMIDVDHVAQPRELFSQISEAARGLGLLVAHVTPSTRGLRLVFPVPAGMDAEKAQTHYAKTLKLKNVDACTKDLARLSFCVPEEYFLFVDEERLFNDNDNENDNDNDNENDNLAGARSSDENEAASPSVDTAADGSAFPECYEVMGGSFADTAEGGLPPHLGRAGGEATAIPYRLIVEALQELLGGIPAHGSRNNFIFTMAAYLRYVCNDDPEWIASILPTYGETAEKWRRTIDSACQRAQYKVMPQIVRRALAQAQARQRDSVEVQRSEEGDNLPPAMPRKLPRLIAHLVKNVPEVCRPAVANAVFPALAAHLKGVKFPLIDGTEKEATFMCVTMAKQSSGKSAINKPIEYITADIVERDEINRKREQEWKDASANKASNKEKPKRPDDLCVQVLVSDMTNAAFVQRLKDAGGRYLYTNLEELELLKQLQTNGTKDVGKIICLCFDNGKYGQERVGTQSVTARVEVRWNWNAASTIQKGIQFFRGRLVDGTLSRVNFCTILPDKSKPFTYGTYDDAYAGTLKPYITNLNLADGRIECRQALDLARRLEDKCAEEGTLSDDEIYQDLAHRAVTIAYLKAMVLYIASDMTWTKEIGEFAEWSLQYDLWCKMHFFGELMREEEERENVAKIRSRQNLLDLLPDTFTLQNALDVRRAQGMSESGCRQMIRQWIFRGYIDQEPTLGAYIKTEKYLGRER